MANLLYYLLGVNIPATKKYEQKTQRVADAISLIEKIENSHDYKRFLRYSANPTAENRERLEKLQKSKRVKIHAKLLKKYTKEIRIHSMWEEMFSEHFSSRSLDQWSTKSFWTEEHLNQPYAQSTELQLPTDGKNLEFVDTQLAIVTRKEGVKGVAWDSKLGFLPKTFSYTSGTINTSGTFSQQYGKFSAKLKLSRCKNLYHAFWLGCNTLTPHINVCKVINGRVEVGAYTNGKKAVKRLLPKLVDDSYIFSLTWDPSRIVWSINGKKVYETAILPDVPLYLNFASGVVDEIADGELPLSMNIEWVKCLKKK